MNPDLAPTKISDLFKDRITFENIKLVLREHNYEYLSCLGHGSFSTVILAESIKYQQNFVIKIRQYDKCCDEEVEIQTLIKLDHQNIISIYEYFADSSFLYIVLEYCNGGSFVDYLKQHFKFDSNIILPICAQLLSALHLCHSRNIAHRDIKPDNILIDHHGRAKLADFGLSTEYEKGHLMSKIVGSRPYMAPEIMQKKAYDPFKADIWALGVTFYQMALGRLPWSTSNLMKMQAAINVGMINFPNDFFSIPFSKVIRSMLEVNPKKRIDAETLLQNPIF